ncbi:MAG TPA: DUF1648 domain-containing protein [Steroidobacteraceae bacterium]|jgi:uncharacterized membrane protein|nr:DUF1648 domain-containing protein [Steroidobacteraceae bacterium]
MNEPTPRPPLPAPFLVLIGAALGFVVWSGRSLPDLVAAHFDSGGRTNGYMPKVLYLALMLLVTAVVPLLLVILPRRALAGSVERINVPNRDYWLAPERRAETVRFLSRQMTLFAALVIVFLCYVQWLVVRANALTPPSLSSRALLIGLAIFLGCTFAWTLRVIGRFARRA